jgi:hypothetical protein
VMKFLIYLVEFLEEKEESNLWKHWPHQL